MVTVRLDKNPSAQEQIQFLRPRGAENRLLMPSQHISPPDFDYRDEPLDGTSS